MTEHQASAQIQYAIDNTLTVPQINAWNLDLEQFVSRLHDRGLNAFTDDAALDCIPPEAFSGAYASGARFYQSVEEALRELSPEEHRAMAEYLRAKAVELRQRMPEMAFLLAGQRFNKDAQCARIVRITADLFPKCEVRFDLQQPTEWIRAGFFHPPGHSIGATLHEQVRKAAVWSDRDLAKQIAARLGAFAEIPQ